MMGAGIVWGGRMVIPPPAREYLLVELHEGHSGVSGMKALMQSLMWRPGMDHEIKDIVRHCTVNELKPQHPQLCCIRLHVCGQDYMWILQVLWMAECT